MFHIKHNKQNTKHAIQFGKNCKTFFNPILVIKNKLQLTRNSQTRNYIVNMTIAINNETHFEHTDYKPKLIKYHLDFLFAFLETYQIFNRLS